MLGASDTSPEVEQMLIDCYRRMPVSQKWANLRSAYMMARGIHAAGHRHRNPGATGRSTQEEWILSAWNFPSPTPIPEDLLEPSKQDFQPALSEVIATFERLSIGYAFGGSIASSLHGIGRMTQDADLTAVPFPGKERAFVEAFDPKQYYLNLDTVREAVRTRSTFNIIHPATGYKIDVFVQKDDPFEQSAYSRCQSFAITEVPGRKVPVHSPEDIIQFKLRRFRIGGEVSDRQWTDILNVMKVQGERLGQTYLDRWAAEIGVGDLLARARVDAKI